VTFCVLVDEVTADDDANVDVTNVVSDAKLKGGDMAG
jgi:hypothetical protein